jgi:hypothetical protein
MKKLVLYIMVASTLVLQSGCMHKTEDDPYISLRTRKARLIGKWELETAEGTYSELYSRGYEDVWKYKNGVETYFRLNPNWPNTDLKYWIQLEFKEDETYKWVHIPAIGEIGTMTGKWNFIHDDQRRENKTKLLLQPDSIAGEWPNDVIIQFPLRQQSPIFEIEELRHNKVVLSRSYELEYLGSTTGLPITGSETFRFVLR